MSGICIICGEQCLENQKKQEKRRETERKFLAQSPLICKMLCSVFSWCLATPSLLSLSCHHSPPPQTSPFLSLQDDCSVSHTDSLCLTQTQRNTYPPRTTLWHSPGQQCFYFNLVYCTQGMRLGEGEEGKQHRQHPNREEGTNPFEFHELSCSSSGHVWLQRMNFDGTKRVTGWLGPGAVHVLCVCVCECVICKRRMDEGPTSLQGFDWWP